MFRHLSIKYGLKRAAIVRKYAKGNKVRFTFCEEIPGYDKRVGLILKGFALVGAIGAAAWFCGFAVDNFSSIAIPGQVIVTVLEDGSGYQTYERVDSTTAIKRECIHQALSAILAPQESRHYVVVMGGSGTGKSTAVRQVLASLSHPVGALYFDCPPNVNLFSQQLAKQLQCRYERGLQLGDLTAEPFNTFAAVQGSLLEAGSLYKAKHNRPLVIVIDSADLLAERCPAFLESLQDFAKDCADRGTIRFVFICGDGPALPLLMVRSAWSRAEKPAFEVGEIPSADAVKYLEVSGVPEAIAAQAVIEVTGGLFTALNDFAADHAKGRDLTGIKTQLSNATATTLIRLDVSPDHSAFKEITANGSITTYDAHLHGLTQQATDSLIRHNILAIHPDGQLTFHDQFVKMWFATGRSLTN
jgi:hypothetical protein